MTKDLIYNAIDFSRQYFLLRKKEGRVYSDEEVVNLPEINRQHQFYDEWEIRKRSSLQLKKYLAGKKRPLQILEIGCGEAGILAAEPSLQQKYTGVDFSHSLITRNQERYPNATFFQLDNPNQLPFEDKETGGCCR